MNNQCCYKCEKRFIGCHTTCEAYAEYRKRKDVIISNRQKRNSLEGGLFHNVRRYK